MSSDANEILRRRLRGAKRCLEEQSENVPSRRKAFFWLAVSAALFAWSFYAGSIEYIAWLLLVIFIHEFGHLVAMRLCGYKDLRMLFLPFLGAFASGRKHSVNRSHSAWVSLAGPLPGILIGAVLAWYSITQYEPYFERVVDMFIVINGLNLLPFPPLDGGRMLQSVLFYRNLTVSLLFHALAIVGTILLLLHLKMYLFAVLLLYPIGYLNRITPQTRVVRTMRAQCLSIPENLQDLDDETFAKMWPIMSKYWDYIDMPETLATTLTQISELYNTRPMAWWKTIGFLFLYVLFAIPSICIALFAIT